MRRSLQYLIATGFALLPLLLIPGCQRDLSPFDPNLSDSLYIRVYNNSPYVMQNVMVDRTQFGTVEKFSFSRYKVDKRGNQYSLVQLLIDGESYFWAPNDFAASPFRDGHYLFLISPHQESRQLFVSICYDDRLPPKPTSCR